MEKSSEADIGAHSDMTPLKSKKIADNKSEGKVTKAEGLKVVKSMPKLGKLGHSD